VVRYIDVKEIERRDRRDRWAGSRRVRREAETAEARVGRRPTAGAWGDVHPIRARSARPHPRSKSLAGTSQRSLRLRDLCVMLFW